VVFDDVSVAFDDKVVLEHASFKLEHGHMLVLLGASGAGKSTVLRLILGLLRPDSGQVLVDGCRVDEMPEAELMKVRTSIGMVFQEGALFDSLTVRENTGYRLFEETDQPIDEVDRRVQEVLSFVELSDLGDRMPSELSGGQRRRVGIARAIASHPRLVLYDEPTTGLDPITAVAIDDEIVKLRDLEQVTSIVVTHQLRDAFYIAGHTATRAPDGKISFAEAPPDVAAKTTFLMIKDGRVQFNGSAQALRESADPYLKSFLS
jgi:phospholipid/cholesterol/gamma-HCH transport system ATP-binding protein